jgi:glycosyltransferase involved in cell wall biosynthesis
MYILGIYLDTSAVGHYRIIQPLTKVMEQGLASVHLYNFKENGHDYARMTECIDVADIIILPRPHNEKWFEIMKAIRKVGKAIVIDHDDDVFNLSPLNPYYKYIGVNEVKLEGSDEYLWHDGMTTVDGKKVMFDIEKNMRTRDMLRICCNKADAISVTTDILAETFSNHNKNTVVLPNLIDLNLFKPLPLKKTDRVRIMWQGGHSHYGDIYLIKDVFRRIIEKYDNVDFVIFGQYFKGVFKEIPPERIKHEPWVQHVAYPYRLPALNCDIGIAPLEDNQFNKNKSCIKYLEYGAVGMPTVASNVSPYKEVIQDGQNGFLANNDDEWVDKVGRLIEDVELRDKMAKEAYNEISGNHCADKFAFKWVTAYDKILKGEIK